MLNFQKMLSCQISCHDSELSSFKNKIMSFQKIKLSNLQKVVIGRFEILNSQFHIFKIAEHVISPEKTCEMLRCLLLLINWDFLVPFEIIWWVRNQESLVWGSWTFPLGQQIIKMKTLGILGK